MDVSTQLVAHLIGDEASIAVVQVGQVFDPVPGRRSFGRTTSEGGDTASVFPVDSSSF